MGQLLDALAAELGISSAELEAELLAEGSEASIPSYLTLNPDGSLGALSFSGRTAVGAQAVSGAFPGGSTTSAQATIAHQLGAVPTSVVCTQVDPTAGGIIVSQQYLFEIQNLTATTFDVRVLAPSGAPAAGTTVPFYFVAISGDRALTVDFATGNVAAPDSWHRVGNAGEPAYQNGFVQSFRPLEFSKDLDGVVHMRGLVQTPNPVPAIGATIFVLPAGYRPGVVLQFAVGTNSADTTWRAARVLTDGTVTAGDDNQWAIGEFNDLSMLSFRSDL